MSWFQDSPPSIHDPDGDGIGLIEFADGDVTNSLGFSDDEGQNRILFEGQRIWMYLQWEDSWPGASADLDLYLVDSASGEIVASGEDIQSGGDFDIPTESIYFVIPDEGQYHLEVGYWGGNLPDWIQLTAPKAGSLEHSTEGYSIGGVAESANPGMLAVGATPLLGYAHYRGLQQP